MQKWFLSGIILVFIFIGCSKLFNFEMRPNVIVEGTVLSVNQDTTLISLRLDLTTEDLNKTYDEWMNRDYKLLEVSALSTVEVGTEVKLILKDGILESYPARATVKSYETIGKVEVSQVLTDKESVIESDRIYHEDLLGIFPKTVGLIQGYHGYGEYGYFQRLVRAEEVGTSFELNFEGQIIDGMGGFEARLFNLKYQVDSHSVVEHIVNYDGYNPFEDELLLHSIIPNKVILKTPLEVGNSWIESFSYKGKDYLAETVITRMSLNTDGKQEYETSTIVEGIEYHDLGIYKETRVFTEGSGMTSFNNLFSLEVLDNSPDDLYIFGFSLGHEEITQ